MTKSGKIFISLCLLAAVFIQPIRSVCAVDNCATCVEGNDNQCATCADTYGLTDAGKCVKPTIDNCKLISDTAPTKCATCADTYGLTDAGKCVSPVIANCQTISDADKTKCATCAETYGLTDAGKCVKPTIENCKLISDTAPTKCATCADTYGLTDAGKCVSPVLANCQTISDADKTKCAVCADKYGLTEDAKCVTAISGCAVISKDDNKACKTCNEGYTLNDKKLCDAKATPTQITLTATRAAESADVTINYDCKTTTPVDAYVVYSVGQAALALSLADVKAILADSTKMTNNQKNSWLQIEELKQVTKQDGYKLLKPLRNSGASYSIKLLCSESTATASFTTLDTKSQSTVVTITTDKALTDAQVSTVGTNMLTFLGIDVTKNPVYSEKGAKIVKAAPARILADSVTKFYVYPDYSLATEDKTSATLVEKLKDATAKTELIKGVEGVAISAVAGASQIMTNNPASIVEAFPAPKVDKESIQLGLKVSGTGRVSLAYKKLAAKANSTNTTMDYDAFSAVKELNTSLYKNITAESANAIDFKIEGLTKDSSYQVYYYADNQGVPTLYSAVYGQIITTAAEPTGLENLKFGFLMLAVLVLALLR